VSVRRGLATTALAAGILLATGAPAGASRPAARDFVAAIDNPFFPLKPGTVLRYAGTQDRRRSRTVVTVTHGTRAILGVRCVAVHDDLALDGKPAERTTDWYAQDRQGTVWYFGERSFERLKGRWVLSDGSWQAGVNGARQGILMEAHPHPGDHYRQEFLRGHAEDAATVLSTTASAAVPAGRFHPAVLTRETSRLEPGVVEHKLYGRGVGEVRSLLVRGGAEEQHLVAVRRTR
jgi:hypothetical protein